MKKVFRIILVMIFMSAVLLAVSCFHEAKAPKKQTGAPNSQTANKDHNIITAEEVSKIMGAKLVRSYKETNKNYGGGIPNGIYCGFTNNGATPDVLRAMPIYHGDFLNVDLAKEAFKGMKKELENLGMGIKVETVSKLSDEAYWASQTLYVRIGKTELAVTVLQPEKEGKDKAIAAAKIIIPRL